MTPPACQTRRGCPAAAGLAERPPPASSWRLIVESDNTTTTTVAHLGTRGGSLDRRRRSSRRDLGHPGSLTDGPPDPGTRSLPSGDRQQAQGLRPDLVAGPRDICHGDRVAARARVMQRKTQRPVQFEITAPVREAVEAWIRKARLQLGHRRIDSTIR